MAFDKKLVLVRDPRDWLVSGTLLLIQQEAHLDEEDAAEGGRGVYRLRPSSTSRASSYRPSGGMR